MKVIPLHCEYLDKRFHFVGDCNKKQIGKWLETTYKPEKFNYDNDSDGTTWFWENKKNRAHVVIWVDKTLKGDNFMSALYHEVAHAIFFLMKRAGVDPLDSWGEHFCYLQEYLFRQVVDKLKNKPKLANKKSIDKPKK